MHDAHAGAAAGTAGRRCASGTSCRRRPAPRRRSRARARALSAPIATEVSAFLTANVPPNPQHSSAPRQVDQPQPAHRLEQPARPVADAEHPQRVAGRVVGHPVREVGPDVGDAEHVDEELGQLVGPRARSPRPPRPAPGRRRAGRRSRAGGAPTRRTSPTASPPRRTRRRRRRRCAPPAPPRRGSRCSPSAGRSRSAPAGNSTSTPSRRSSVTTALPGVGEHRVVDAGDHQGDLHRPPSQTACTDRVGAIAPRLVGAAPPGRAAPRGRRSRRPRRGAWTSTLPSAVASTGPASTGSPQRSAISLAEQRVLGAAADDVHDVAPCGRTARRPRRTPRANASARLSTMLRTSAGRGRRARRGRARRTTRAIRAGMSPAAGTAGPGRRRPAPDRSHVGGLGQQRRQVAARPALPAAQRLAEQPRPHHVGEEPDPAVDAALVGEVRRPGRVGQHRRVQLDADQPPGAAGDVRRVVARPSARRRPPRRCRGSRPS